MQEKKMLETENREEDTWEILKALSQLFPQELYVYLW